MRKNIDNSPLKNIDEREVLVAEFYKKEVKNEKF